MFFYIRWAISLVILALLAAVLHYNLPQWDTVRISDTYEKRVTPGSNAFFWGSGSVGEMTDSSRDVFFIQTIRPSGKPMVYRNEDRPLWFKFDTANLQAQASDLRSTELDPRWVAIKHYGWRNEYFSIYPNALAVKPVGGPEARVIPWVSIGILVLVLMVFWAIMSRVFRFLRNRVSPRLDRMDQRIAGWRARRKARRTPKV